MPHSQRWALVCLTVALAALLPAASAHAGRELRGGGKLLLTGGVTSIDGAGGGGLSSWALIAGDETRDGIGGTIHATAVPLADFSLTSYGAAIGVFDKLELSYAHQSFDTRGAGATLGLGRGFRFGQNIFGAKLRIAGDAVYDQDSALPQIAIGVQYHVADRSAVIHAVGGRHATGTDLYVAATKVLLGRSLVVGATLRMTKANQFGLLGFGGDRHAGYSPQVEASAGYLVARNLLVGGEMRTKPDNLRFAAEQDAYDLFAAFAAGHHLTFTAAYVDLGSIATLRGQRGAFLSVQAGF